MAFPNFDNDALEYRDLRRLCVATSLYYVRTVLKNVDLSGINPPPVRNGIQDAFDLVVAELTADQINTANVVNIESKIWDAEVNG